MTKMTTSFGRHDPMTKRPTISLPSSLFPLPLQPTNSLSGRGRVQPILQPELAMLHAN
jgi:hypothetical protein